MQESQVLEVSYGQISVFDAATSTPFSLWEDRHVHQGFTWREGAVGFRTMAENGPFHVTLTEGSTGVSESSVLLVDVPFLSRSGKVVVATLPMSSRYELPLVPINCDTAAAPTTGSFSTGRSVSSLCSG